MTEAEAMNVFVQQHGDEDTWTPQEVEWHDLLLAKVRQENLEAGDEADRPEAK